MKKAFTVIELLVVVAILAIIGVIIAPIFTHHVTKASYVKTTVIK